MVQRDTYRLENDGSITAIFKMGLNSKYHIKMFTQVNPTFPYIQCEVNQGHVIKKVDYPGRT